MTNNFVQGGVVAIIGICTVFVVLAILWATLELMRVFFTRGSAEKKAAAKPVPTQTTTPAPVVIAQEQTEDDELIAVLTAAVAACLGQPASRFNIKNYRKLESGAPIWNRTARRDNLIG